MEENRTEELKVVFGCKPGMELLSAGGKTLQTNPAGAPGVWTIYLKESGEVRDYSDADIAYDVQTTEDGRVWRAALNAGECGALRVAVQARVEKEKVSFEVFEEGENDEACVVTFRLNGLCAATTNDPDTRLALPAHGGRLIDPAITSDGQTDHRYNWILDSFGSFAVAYGKNVTALVRVLSMDDQLTSRVGQASGGRYAQMGALLRLRYTKNDVSYRKAKPRRDESLTEDAEFLPISECFKVQDRARVDVYVKNHPDVAPETGWTIGAQMLRDMLPGKRTDYYRDKMIYKIYVGSPNQPVATTYKRAGEIIRDVAARTGGAGQLAYIVGFQHEGHDNGYPDVYTPNVKPGTADELKALVEDAGQYNAVVSFHDNFDDAYAQSPAWDRDDISRDSFGHLLRGGVWNGVQAYWNSMPYYADHKAEARVTRTMATYPYIKDTYHLDVLTASVFRIDFRKESPTGRQADLEGRKRIVECFRAHGLDVTSEACGLPFIGTISYFWHMQRVARPVYEGDTRIPMVPFMAHGKTDYAGSHATHPAEILDGLLYGAFYCNDVTATTPVKELTDAYFMLQAPLNLLRDDRAVSYETAPDGWKIVNYASGARIAVQFEGLMCRVDIGGVRYVENGTAMIPKDEKTTLLYRAWEEPYDPVMWRCGLPEGTKLTAKAVGVSLPDETLTVDENGCVAVETPLGVAYEVKK